jgi:hypothetical protein
LSVTKFTIKSLEGIKGKSLNAQPKIITAALGIVNFTIFIINIINIDDLGCLCYTPPLE